MINLEEIKSRKHVGDIRTLATEVERLRYLLKQIIAVAHKEDVKNLSTAAQKQYNFLTQGTPAHGN
jgi:hypothetical protein